MSLEAIRARKIPLLGIAFIGDANEDSERIICKIGSAKRLGRLDPVAPLDRRKSRPRLRRRIFDWRISHDVPPFGILSPSMP